jgi:hypothetical protein
MGGSKLIGSRNRKPVLWRAGTGDDGGGEFYLEPME